MGGVSDAERAKIAARHSDIPSDTLERATDLTMSLELAARLAEGLHVAVCDLDARLNSLGYNAILAEQREQYALASRWLAGTEAAWECHCSWLNEAAATFCDDCADSR